MPHRAPPITEKDFRAVVHILADLASMDGSSTDKRNHLMGEISALIGADSWIWGAAPLTEPGNSPAYLFQNSGGLTDTRLASLLKAIEHPDSGAITARLASEMIAAGNHITRLRQDLIDDDGFSSSAAHPLWREADIGPILFSVRPVFGRGASISGFCRTANAPLFTTREARIVHVVLTEVAWLHDGTVPDGPTDDLPKLPPRCRVVLNELIHGRSRKEIATDLGLSIHTVNDYMKQIFRHFQVHSQIDLITRLRFGDGHDRA